MVNRLDGRLQVFGPAGTAYPALFQPLANVTSSALAPDQTSFRLRYLDGNSVLYTGSGLGYDGTTLSGTVTGLTVLDAADAPLATLTSTEANPFRVDGGLAVHTEANLYALLLSGDNLLVGSANGLPAMPEVLAGGTGNDTYRPGNGRTTLLDGVGSGVTTLDLSGLAGPATVDLLSQTFAAGAATGTMSGVTHLVGTQQDDTVLGNADGRFAIATGAGNDSIQAYGETLFGGRFAVTAGAGDDTITIDQRGFGTIDGGAGHDTLQAGGDISFYSFTSIETLANTNFLRVRTDQLRTIQQITDLNPFNGDEITVHLVNDGTVDFGRLMGPGLSVSVIASAPGTNVNGTDGNDRFQDASTSLVDGFRTPATFYGAGGDDTLFNNSGLAVFEFSGSMADYTITRAPSLGSDWIITDDRPGSPDGTDLIIGANQALPMLRFRDHFASIIEQLAYKADPTQLPAQIYNGILQLFGPDNFDYQGMFPKPERAASESLAADGSSYTIDYSNFTRIVFKGAGLSTSGPLTPDGGSVEEILVYDTTLPGSPMLLARFYSEPVSGHLLKVPFTPELLAGGARVYQLLMSGNNHVDGSPNSDLLVADKGFNTIAAGEGFDVLHLGRNVDSFTTVLDADGNVARVDYIDGPGGYDEFDPFEDPIPGEHPAPAVLNAITTYFDNIGPNGELPPLPDFIRSIILAMIGGDPHVVTLDGVSYSFHSLGEFVAAKSTIVGDPFEIQVRHVPFVGLASVVSQAATMVGDDRVTFHALRSGDDVVRINGLAVDFTGGPIALGGGTLTKLASGSWRLAYSTGETLSVNELSTGIDFLTISLDPGSQRARGTLQGILGNHDGDRANDFQLPDGTVLARPLSQQMLYTTFADAWRVADANSLLDYGLGEATGSFTSRIIPPAFSIADLPPEVLAHAEAVVNAAGIADRALRDFAIYDYVLTGDPIVVTSLANQAASGVVAVEREAPAGPPAETMLGIIATEASVVEAASGQTTAVAFQVYRTGPALGDVVVNWRAVAPGAGFLDAGDFGGTLPSGSVTIPNGSASANLLVHVPDGAVTQVSERLRVEIAGPTGVTVAAPGAQAEIVNNGPIQGTPAEAEFRLITGPGTLSHDGDDWVLDLGSLSQGAAVAPLIFAIANTTPSGGNDLSGTFETDGTLAGFSGTGTVLRLTPGGLKGGIGATIETAQTGLLSSVLTFRASESNGSGYRGVLADETLTIRATIVGPNASPIAAPDSYALARGRVSHVDAALGVGANDTDDGPLTFALLAAPGHGAVVLNPDGSFTYTAADGFVGETSFTYRATDAGGLFSDATVTLTLEERAETLSGTETGERIFGYGLDDIIDGLGGNDRIFAGSGNDTVNAGEGNDRVLGEDGEDTINGEDGNDIIWSGAGNDMLDGGSGSDQLVGEAGDDTIQGGAGNDRIRGQGGDDTIDAGADNDHVQGGDGDDTVQGGAGNDLLHGDADDDVLAGDAGDDIAHGGEGNDTLLGGKGNDRLNGDAGRDRIEGGAGLDFLNGGADADVFVLARVQADRDWISGFVSGEDKLEIDATLFGGGLAPGALDPTRLVVGTNPVATQPGVGTFLFDTDDGRLRWDADGSGPGWAPVIATLTGGASLASTDFFIA